MAEKKKRSWGRLVLGISLALNLLIVGIVAGGLLSRGQGPEARVGVRDTGLFALIVMLPPDERRELRSMLDQRSASDGGRKQSGKQHHARIVETLRADPFDPDQFQTVLSQRRLDQNLWAADAESALAARVEGLDAVQRKDYANRLDQWSRSRHRRDDGRRAKK